MLMLSKCQLKVIKSFITDVCQGIMALWNESLNTIDNLLNKIINQNFHQEASIDHCCLYRLSVLQTANIGSTVLCDYYLKDKKAKS